MLPKYYLVSTSMIAIQVDLLSPKASMLLLVSDHISNRKRHLDVCSNVV